MSLGISSDLVLCELLVADGTALVEHRMRAKAEDEVIGVILPSVRGGARRAYKEVGPGGSRGGFLGGVMPHCLVTFMEEFLIGRSRTFAAMLMVVSSQIGGSRRRLRSVVRWSWLLRRHWTRSSRETSRSSLLKRSLQVQESRRAPIKKLSTSA